MASESATDTSETVANASKSHGNSAMAAPIPDAAPEGTTISMSSPVETFTDPAGLSSLPTEATVETTIQTPSNFERHPANIMHQFRFHSLLSTFESNSPINDPHMQFAKTFTPQAMELDFGRLDAFTSLNEFPYEYHWGENGVPRNLDAVLLVDTPTEANATSVVPTTTEDVSSIPGGQQTGLTAMSVLKPQQSSWQGSFELSENKRAEIMTNISQTYSQV